MREKIAIYLFRTCQEECLEYDSEDWTELSDNDKVSFYEEADQVLTLISEEIEKARHKPNRYHYVCWASGCVKVRDEWGTEETYKCRSFDGDFNCGYRGCEDGIIKGDKELTNIEQHENWMLQKILALLKE